MDGWFPRACRVQLGSDPGLALRVLTGCSESSGYRYASGERPVPEFVVRELLHSPNGWQWLCARMEGCTDSWWRDLQFAKQVGEQVIAITRDR